MPPDVHTKTTKKWYRDGLRFSCTQCGNCCTGAPGYVWVTREEMAQMAAYLGMEVEAFRKRYVRRVGFKFSLIEKPNYDCIFLENRDGRRVCQVYPVRPLQCRTWPFWSSNLKSPGSWAAAAETCPGMNTGDVKRYHQIERIRTAKKWADLT